jgi:hypothetical protein
MARLPIAKPFRIPRPLLGHLHHLVSRNHRMRLRSRKRRRMRLQKGTLTLQTASLLQRHQVLLLA